MSRPRYGRSPSRVRTKPGRTQADDLYVRLRREASAYSLHGMEVVNEPPVEGTPRDRALRRSVRGYGLHMVVRRSTRPWGRWQDLLDVVRDRNPGKIPVVVMPPSIQFGPDIYTDEVATILPLGDLFVLALKAHKWDEHERRIDA